MASKTALLQKLEGTAPKPKLIVDQQQVRDIMAQMLVKHEACKVDYDLIYRDFLGGDIREICERLYDFCEDNIKLKTEGEEKQFVSCPYTILKRGSSDCKCYALFCSGVLDAISRNTDIPIDWCYRFASYNFLDSTPYHVFTVVNPKTDNIWIDPVLGEFNYHYGYWYKRDRKPRQAKKIAGFLSDDFLNSLDPNAIAAAQQSAYTADHLAFPEAGQGMVLPSIPGYPDGLPRLQITPTGRLAFYEWPLTFHPQVWIDFKTGYPLDQPLSTMDYNGAWQRIGTMTRITQDQCNQMKKDYNNGDGPAMYDWCVQTGPSSIFERGTPRMWINSNIQYYINKYLNNPYNLLEPIPYGTNWDEQLNKIIVSGDKNKLVSFLGGLNFLVQPVGTQGFWDKFYLAAPLVISAIAAIVTEGAATPALLLALGNMGIKYGEAKAAATSAADLPQQGTPSVNTGAVQADIDAANPSLIKKVMTWIQNHPIPAFAILAAAAYLIYEQEKK